MDTNNVTVDLRLSTKADNKVKAFATIPLGSDGLIKISGFSVIQEQLVKPASCRSPCNRISTPWP